MALIRFPNEDNGYEPYFKYVSLSISCALYLVVHRENPVVLFYFLYLIGGQ